MPPLMHLEILLPFQVFADRAGVTRIVAEGQAGCFGLLPRRLDCAVALVPGILTYEVESGAEVYVAVDQGVLVKAGPEVRVSARRAVGGSNLADLRDLIEREFLTLGEEEQRLRTVMARVESAFLRHFASLHHE